jgi:rhamnosyltransferase
MVPVEPKKAKNNVCAVVVTFRPDATVEANLATTRSQVEAMIVIDNTPAPDRYPGIRKVCDKLAAHLVENDNNVGLPAALNIGISYAIRSGYPWVVLFDQDSTATDGMIGSMLEAYEANAGIYKVGIVTPRYRNRLTGEVDPLSPPFLADNMLDAAWTSGSLVPTKVFQEVGGFENALFIDQLDYEFSLRVRRAGYVIVLAREASLLHEGGFPRTRHIFGISMRTDNHKPARRYYTARNRVWIMRKYYNHFPHLLRRNIARQAKETVWMFVCEKNRWSTAMCIASGLWDGLIGRMGNTMDL